MEIRRYEDKTVVAVTESRPILFTRLVSKIASGAQIGAMQAGLACIGNRKIYERGTGRDVRDPGLVQTMNETLSGAGYSVVRESASLFDRAKEWQADLRSSGRCSSAVPSR
jgi:hypothetical protein